MSEITAGLPAQPQRSDGSVRVVALGASAGGIAALRTFFSHVPPSSGLAYVVILHLSPEHESQLADVLQRSASMPVTQVSETTAIERDHVYVMPPNRGLEIFDGRLVLSEMSRSEQRRAPIDLFFRALADAQGASATSVVLSGTGADGSSGFKRIKEHGGLTIAQDPAEAEFPDMPANAIATGFIDLILPVAAMPAEIVSYYERLHEAEARTPVLAPGVNDAEAMREILTLLRVRTGHDFSNYKTATLLRRTQRRLSVRQLQTLGEYAQLMREDPAEPAALMKDLLISVTNFFRDPEAFSALETRIIPRLFDGKRDRGAVRVWSAGCATGEEAYSLAMLLAEREAAIPGGVTVQIFASDLDEQAVAVAREGFYTEAEVADVSEERLQRFFQRVPRGYRVRRELRERVMFAHHDLIKDPPFSHLDLIACRNVLIYLNRPVQEQLLETFHFALRPGGCLFLGGSEVPDGRPELFAAVDKNQRLYETRNVAGRLPLPLAETIALPARLAPRVDGLVNRVVPASVHQRLLEQYAPPSIVVTEDHLVLHISEGATRYMQIPPGAPTRQLFSILVPGLRTDLRTALRQAAHARAEIRLTGVIVSLGGDRIELNITVRPTLRDGDPGNGLFLVLFDEQTVDDDRLSTAVPVVHMTSPPHVDAGVLDDEVERVRDQLRGTIEQYETQVEEAKASNEELQAMNEELRSAAEELETSKEELQSVNEELTTVNQELKIKISELALTNNDFQNFMNSTEIATIFLDRHQRVKLATPRMGDIFNLLPADVGRRLSDITSSLTLTTLHADIAGVIERLQVVEREVQTEDGRSYFMRILPYRTADDHIDGVVITFLDITKRLADEERVRRGEERLRLLIDSAIDYAIFTMTPQGIIDSWNPGAERMFGYTTSEIIDRPAEVLFTPEDRAEGAAAAELLRARLTGRAEDERWHIRKDGTRLYCSGVTTAIGRDAGLGFAKIARDLTSQREAAETLKRAHDELEARVATRTVELERRVQRHAEAERAVINLVRRLVTAQEDERARIARDLHDQLGQQLTALRLTLEHDREARVAAGDPAADVDKALAITQQIDEEVDFLAWELRPATLDDLGLLTALPRYVGEWSRHYGIAAEVRCRPIDGRLAPAAEVHVYRVAQEALTNVIKHAQASRVDVILEQRGHQVILVIEDDGIGFDTADRSIAEKGIGLGGMRERAALVGGAIDVESTVGKGTTVFMRVPLEGDAP